LQIINENCIYKWVWFVGDEWAPRVAKLLVGAKENPDGSVRKPVERSKVLDMVDDLGYTPLHYAARNWQFSLVETLLECEADPSIQDTKGNTPLHLACEGR
jgi:ankyrin repeat protein